LKAVLVTAFFFSAPALAAPIVKPAPAKVAPPKASSNGLESHQDLILKAQNLTLQRDRLQASQILIRAIQRETKGNNAYKDLTRALTELTTVFYTEKAQSVFSVGEAAVETKPREAIESFQEALRLEEGNVTVLKSLARTQLVLNECEKAEISIRSAEGVDPYSPEVKLLGLQLLACSKSFEALLAKLDVADLDLDTAESYVKSLRSGLQIHALLETAKPKSDLKKARALLSTWEGQMPDYPEIHFWKWELSKAQSASDRTSAAKYAQACQNLSPRKRKTYSLDVNLCKGKEAVDSYLKSSGVGTSPSGNEK
jgi:hypothetical protein